MDSRAASGPPLSRRPLPTRAGTAVLPPNIGIDRITPITLQSFRRLLGTLLPVPYANHFFTSILPGSAFARVALWHDRPLGKRKRSGPKTSPDAPASMETANEVSEPEGRVVGGIRCRIEPLPPLPGSNKVPCQLYIQTLATLSPFRGHGIATHLLRDVMVEALKGHEGLDSIYAHVWEANSEALEWYVRRGFSIEEELVEGYYRRLKPGGARIVRRSVGVGDWLAVEKEGSDSASFPSAASFERPNTNIES